MDGDWKLLAQHAQRRRAELGLSQIEVAQRGPLSLDRVQAIEGAKRSRYRLGTLLALERALEWADGSVESVLGGGRPTTIESTMTPDDVNALLDENERIVAELLARVRKMNNERKRQVVIDIVRAMDDENEHSGS